MDYYAVYDRPSDYPNDIVVRRFTVGRRGELIAHEDVQTYPTIEAARKVLKNKGLYQYPRNRDDDPVIVETWL